MKSILKANYVITEKCSLKKDQQCFLVDLLPLLPPFPKAVQVQHDEDSKLALRLAIAE